MSQPSITERLQRARGRKMGSLYPDAPAILVYESVLEQILDYSERDLARELGGFLIGEVHELPEPHVEIRRFLPATGAKRGYTSVTFTHDTWSALTREVDSSFAGERVVGWQHTHPGFGIFLSSYDLFIHRHFFSAPWQVALVVDPRKQEFGFFQWRGEEIVDCGFICVNDPESLESSLTEAGDGTP
jgi:proteasome lid subunit RPN8/RPN11